MAAALPEVTEGSSRGNRSWSVGAKAFAWERPFSKADITRFGDARPPEGPILAVRVDDLGEKEAALSAHARAFFTIPHFDGYAAVLVQLARVTKTELREAIVDGWLACAPAHLTESYLNGRYTDWSSVAARPRLTDADPVGRPRVKAVGYGGATGRGNVVP
jgi:hypothetical protein